MKFSLACLAAVAVNAQEGDDDKKFSNKNGFMNSSPPKWWNKHSSDKRMEWLEKNTNKFFKMHFDGTKAEDNLKPLFEDLIADARRIEISCDSSDVSRKRRAFSADDEEENDDGDATADEGDPMDADTSAANGTRKVTGAIKKDAKRHSLNIARWIKYQVYDQGGECEFLGLRMVRFLSFWWFNN